MRVCARELRGEKLPRWYGVAWHELHTDELVLLPIPFNVVARAARWLYWATWRFLKTPPPRGWERHIHLAGYAKGAEDGKRLGQIEETVRQAERMRAAYGEGFADGKAAGPTDEPHPGYPPTEEFVAGKVFPPAPPRDLVNAPATYVYPQGPWFRNKP